MIETLTISRRAMIAGGAVALALPSTAHCASPIGIENKRTNMNITRSGSVASARTSPDYFTGVVRLDMPFKGTAPARIGGATVTFEAGARTNWHTHPLGQTLIVVSGMGWVQTEGGPKEQIRAGDIVWIPPGEKHWHGATDSTAMSHIAISEALDGKSVDWLEKVSDAQFNG